MREAMDRRQGRAHMEAVWRERANRLSQRPVLAGAGQNAFPVIILGIGKERYGIDLPDVAEVLAPIRATPVPGLARVVLLRKEGREMGLQIDSVEQVRWIDAGDLQPTGNGAGGSHFIKGSTTDLVMLLNTEALFTKIYTGETT